MINVKMGYQDEVYIFGRDSVEAVQRIEEW